MNASTSSKIRQTVFYLMALKLEIAVMKEKEDGVNE
jgi:hypothetical protein